MNVEMHERTTTEESPATVSPNGLVRLTLVAESVKRALAGGTGVEGMRLVGAALERQDGPCWVASVGRRLTAVNEPFRRLLPRGVVPIDRELGAFIEFGYPGQVRSALEQIVGNENLAELQAVFSTRLGPRPGRVLALALRTSERTEGLVGIVDLDGEVEGGLPDLARRYRALETSERRVIALMMAGHGNQVVARTLGVSPRTVETRRSSIRRKLGFKSMLTMVQQLTRLEVEGAIRIESVRFVVNPRAHRSPE